MGAREPETNGIERIANRPDRSVSRRMSIGRVLVFPIAFRNVWSGLLERGKRSQAEYPACTRNSRDRNRMKCENMISSFARDDRLFFSL
jgi:hypothetical protein